MIKPMGCSTSRVGQQHDEVEQISFAQAIVRLLSDGKRTQKTKKRRKQQKPGTRLDMQTGTSPKQYALTCHLAQLRNASSDVPSLLCKTCRHGPFVANAVLSIKKRSMWKDACTSTTSGILGKNRMLTPASANPDRIAAVTRDLRSQREKTTSPHPSFLRA